MIRVAAALWISGAKLLLAKLEAHMRIAASRHITVHVTYTYPGSNHGHHDEDALTKVLSGVPRLGGADAGSDDLAGAGSSGPGAELAADAAAGERCPAGRRLVRVPRDGGCLFAAVAAAEGMGRTAAGARAAAVAGRRLVLAGVGFDEWHRWNRRVVTERGGLAAVIGEQDRARVRGVVDARVEAQWLHGGYTAAGRPVLEALATQLGRQIVVYGTGGARGVLWEGGTGAVLEVLLHEGHYYGLLPVEG